MDQDLWTAFCRQPSDRTFAPLYAATRSLAHTLSIRILRDQEDALDAFQSMFCRLLSIATEGDEEARRADIQNLVYRLVVREADNLRKRRTRRAAKETLMDVSAIPAMQLSPEHTAARRELRERVEVLVDTLPEKSRLPLQLHYFHGRSYAEVARILGRPVGTVSVTIARALKKLDPLMRRAGLGKAISVLATLTVGSDLLRPPLALSASSVFTKATATARLGTSGSLASPKLATSTPAGLATMLTGWLPLKTHVIIASGGLALAVLSFVVYGVVRAIHSEPTPAVTTALSTWERPRTAESLRETPGGRIAVQNPNDSSTDHVILRVLTSGGDPIANATVGLFSESTSSWTPGRAPRSTHYTDETGSTLLPKSPGIAAVVAPRYERSTISIVPETQLHIVELSLLGELLIRVSDEMGNPLPGMTVRLIPPLSTPKVAWSHWRDHSRRLLDNLQTLPSRTERSRAHDPTIDDEMITDARSAIASVGRIDTWETGREFRFLEPAFRWERTSDARGEVRFFSLPSGTGYRFGVITEHTLCKILPAFEGSHAHPEPSGDLLKETRTLGPRITDLSGAIEILPGQEAEGELCVFTETGITGRFLFPDGRERRCRVTLLRILDQVVPGASTPEPSHALRRKKEHEGDLEPNGRFWIPTVAGDETKEIRLSGTTMIDGVLHVWFGHRRFFLPSGQRFDLGDIHPIRGRDVAGIIEFDAEGGTESIPSYFQEFPPRSADLRVSNAFHAPQPNVHATILVNIGGPFVLHGLSGKTSYRVRRTADWPVLRPDLRAAFPNIDREKDFLSAEIDEIRLPITLRRTYRHSLRLRFPRVVRGSVHVDYRVVDEESGTDRETTRTADGAHSSIDVVLKDLCKGSVRVFAHTQSDHQFRESYHGFAEFSFDPEEPRAFALDMLPAVSVRVRAVDRATGEAIVNRRITMSVTDPPGFRDWWNYSATTGADGVALFDGIPPGSTVVTHINEQHAFVADPARVEEIHGTW